MLKAQSVEWAMPAVASATHFPVILAAEKNTFLPSWYVVVDEEKHLVHSMQRKGIAFYGML